MTTVVVKPKSRGSLELRSNNPRDMPLVSPKLLKHPNDMKEIIAGQRFFLKAFQTEHPASTARIGADTDPMAVLDAQMRVRGVENLRVCDMSAVPNINAGNTNAPAMMLGDRCADLVMNAEPI